MRREACVGFVCVCGYLLFDREENPVRYKNIFSLVLVARTNMISQAKGSAYIELKKTKVVCSVFDPREIMHQNEYR